MALAKVLNMSGEKVGQIELSDSLFAAEINEHVLHLAVVQQLANNRQGTQSALTRAEVRGGGRKPWRQKGTGRARQGSIRSPQWKGGGVVFAPKPRDYSFKLNKKVKRLALKSALTAKYNDYKVIVLEDLKFDAPKTKEMAGVLKAIGAEKALVVIEGNDSNVVLSARNIPSVKTASVGTINPYDILKYDAFVVTKAAAEKMEEVYA
ncbi:MAG: 50S ribosomal protein L4 [Clostridiales bacterium]|nr:50S ribosomal protein L4 [Clostridiales bacterium]